MAFALSPGHVGECAIPTSAAVARPVRRMCPRVGLNEVSGFPWWGRRVSNIVLDRQPLYRLGQAVTVKIEVEVNGEHFYKDETGWVRAIGVFSSDVSHTFGYDIWPDFPFPYHYGAPFKNHPGWFKEEDLQPRGSP